MEENIKQYTSRDVNRSDRARQLQHIADQPVKRILHAVDNKILQNTPILRKYIRVAEKINGPSVTNFQGKKIRHNIEQVEPIIISNAPKVILYKKKKVNLWCDLIHINGIGFLNTITRYIMFATVSMVKNRKIKNIEDGIKQVHKLYLQRGFKVMRIHADNEFEPLQSDMADLDISLNCASKKEHAPEIEWFNHTVKKCVQY